MTEEVKQIDDQVHITAKIGFSMETDNYDKARPSYPVEAVSRVFEAFDLKNLNQEETINVLDLASGTGIFTKLLQNHKCFKIHAVEPNLEMRNKFSANLGHIPVQDGTSTSIPYPDGYFQIVFVAQAFHWFANVESLEEINRVLTKSKSNGTKSGLVLIWNMEDRNREAYIGELRDLYERFDEAAPQYRKNEWRRVLDETKVFDLNPSEFFETSQNLQRPLIWSRILSKSYIALLDSETKEKIKAQVDSILDKYKHRFFTIDNDNESYLHFPILTELIMCFKKQ